jgi:hypothetical protein
MSTRTQIVKTPGKVVFDPTGTPVILYSSSGISCELQETLVELPDMRFGASEQLVTGRLVEIKFKPTQFTAAALVKLFTHGAVRMGGSIVGATDKLLDVRTVDGVQRRIACAYVHQEPAMQCKTGETILGDVVIRGICGLGADSALLATYWAKSSVAWSDTGWDPAEEITPGWDVSWTGGSASAWDAIDTKDGVIVTPKSELTEDVSNRNGLVNVTIKKYGVEIAAKTLNISEDLFLAARYDDLPLGSRLTSLGRDFKLRAVSLDAFVTCYNAVLQPGSLTYNAADTVVGDLKWMTSPLVTTGVKGPHLLVSTTDPDA